MNDLTELTELLSDMGVDCEARDGDHIAIRYDDTHTLILSVNPFSAEWEINITNPEVDEEGVTVSTMLCDRTPVRVEPRILADLVYRFLLHVQ